MNKQERAEPTPSTRNPQHSDELRLNRAYRCFGFLGIVTSSIALLGLLSEFAPKGIEESWGLIAELVGMLLALPVLEECSMPPFTASGKRCGSATGYWSFSPRSPSFVEEDSCFPSPIGIRRATR